MEKNQSKIIMVLVIVIAVIVLAAVYYLTNQGRMDRRTNLVGDGVCGNFGDEEGQDFCCAEAHKEDAHVKCIGGWGYLEGTKMCEYVCDGIEPGCPEDAKVCDDGSVVVRGGEDCEFDEC